MAKTALAALAACLALGQPGWAVPARESIPTLFNSGVNSAGTPLSDGTIGDPHYALTSVPSLSPTSTIVLRSDGPVGAAVVGPWAGDDNLSAWISPDSPNLGSSAVGEYFYTTTFDLTGFDPATAVIYGAWAADDIGAAIYLNGNLITVLTDLNYGPQNYTGLNTFNYYYRNDQGGVSETVNAPIQSGFVQGINTLSFRVDNLGGATGLRVEMNGTAVPLATVPPGGGGSGDGVPEPASIALIATALVGFLVVRRRFSRVS